MRQFTEAGIPIIDQLAKKFSELEGRAVSAGEVFEKVSNRMVSFKMVDEIFKDMTESGGIFYQMQELQAETLKGKVSNLTDAFQIMLNQIGEGNEGALKGSIDAVRYLIENYEVFIDVLFAVGGAYGIMKVAMLVNQLLLGNEGDAMVKSIKASKLKEASLLRQASLYRTLTATEQATLASTYQLTAGNYMQAISEGKLTKQGAVRLLLGNKNNLQLKEAIVLTGLLTQAEANSVVATGRLAYGWKSAGIAIKSAAVATKAFVASNAWLLAITAVIAGIAALATWNDEYNEKVGELNKKSEEQSDRLRIIAQDFAAASKEMNDATKSATNYGKALDEVSKKKLFGAQLAQLMKLKDEFKAFSLGGLIDLSTITPDNIDEQFQKWNDFFQGVQRSAKEFGVALIEQETAVEAWGLAGDNLQSDVGDLDKAFSNLYSRNLTDNLTTIGALLGEQSNLLNANQKAALDNFNVKKQSNESEEDYNRRRLTDLKSIVKIENGTTAAAQNNAILMSKILGGKQKLLYNYIDLLGDVESKEQEVGKEIQKVIAEYAKSNLISDMSKLTEGQKFELLAAVRLSIADKEYSDMSKDFMIKTALLPFNIDPKLTVPDPKSVDFTGWKAIVEEFGSAAFKVEDYASFDDFFSDLQGQAKKTQDKIELLGKIRLQQVDVSAQIKQAEADRAEAQLAFDSQAIASAEARILMLQNINTKTKEDIANELTLLKAEKQMQEYLASRFSLSLQKEGGGGKDAEAETAKKRIDLYNKIIDLYDKLKKEGYSLAEAEKKVGVEFGEATKKYFGGLDVKKIFGKTFNSADLIALGKNGAEKLFSTFQNYAKSNEAKLSFEEFAGKIRIDATIDVKQVEVSELQKAFEDIKAEYEIGVEIEGMGAIGSVFAEIFDYKPKSLSSTIAAINKELSDIGKNVNIEIDADISLRDLKALTPKFNEAFNNNGATLKIFQDAISLRERLEADYFKKTVSNYQKLLSDYGDYSYQLSEIDRKYRDDKFALDAQFSTDKAKSTPQYKQLVETIYTRKEQSTAKIEFDKFKSTDEWVMAFDDLERISTFSLNSIMDKMLQFKNSTNNLAPTEIKEINNAIEKMRDAIEDRNPFALLASSATELKSAMGVDINALYKQMTADNDALAESIKRVEFAEQLVSIGMITQESELYTTAIEDKTKAENKANTSTKDYSVSTNNLTRAQRKLVKGIIASYEAIDEVIGSAEGLTRVFDEDVANSIGKARALMTSLVNGTVGIIDTIATTTKAAGVGMSISAMMAAESIKMVEKASVILAIIGVALQVATAIADLFIGSKNKAIDTNISNSESKVRSLESAYNDLSRAADRYLDGLQGSEKDNILKSMKDQQRSLVDRITIYDRLSKTIPNAKAQSEELRIENDRLTESIRKVESGEIDNEIAVRRLMATNIDLQRQEIQRQINLENSRKGKSRDPEKIAELHQQYKELGYEIDDTINGITEMLLGTNLKSAAEDFASTWIDAFVSGEDAMLSMGDSFNDMIKNMIVKALAAKVVGKRLEDIFTMVDKAASDDNVTTDEIAAIIAKKDAVLAAINSDMKQYAPLLESLKSTAEEDKLSGLQKGIAGVTEDTASSLESLFNSFLYQSYIHSGLLSTVATQSELISTGVSQMLLIARESYQMLVAMREWQESITANGHKRYGGRFLKVGID